MNVEELQEKLAQARDAGVDGDSPVTVMAGDLDDSTVVVMRLTGAMVSMPNKDLVLTAVI